MKIYRRMEPQPEIEFYEHRGTWYLDRDYYSQQWEPPHKIGDLVPVNRHSNDGVHEDIAVVKSIQPVNRDGVWEWEYDVE